MGGSADPVGLALTHALSVRSALERLREERPGERQALTGEGLVRRVKELPSLMLQTGLVPSLLFYMSKIDDRADLEAFKHSLCLARKGPEAEGLELGRLESELESGEGAGYRLALALVVEAARSLTGGDLEVSEPCQTGGDTLLKDLAIKLKELHESSGRELLVESILRLYLQELKKALEALLAG